MFDPHSDIPTIVVKQGTVDHEDGGMMGVIRVEPGEPPAAKR